MVVLERVTLLSDVDFIIMLLGPPVKCKIKRLLGCLLNVRFHKHVAI